MVDEDKVVVGLAIASVVSFACIITVFIILMVKAHKEYKEKQQQRVIKEMTPDILEYQQNATRMIDDYKERMNFLHPNSAEYQNMQRIIDDKNMIDSQYRPPEPGYVY